MRVRGGEADARAMSAGGHAFLGHAPGGEAPPRFLSARGRDRETRPPAFPTPQRASWAFWAAMRFACAWQPALPQYQSAWVRSFTVSLLALACSWPPTRTVQPADSSSQRPQDEHLRTRAPFRADASGSPLGLGAGGLRLAKVSGGMPQAVNKSTARGGGETRQCGHISLRSTAGLSRSCCNDSHPQARSAHSRGWPVKRGEIWATAPQEAQRSRAASAAGFARPIYSQIPKVHTAPLQQSFWPTHGYSPPPMLQAQTPSTQYSLQQS